MLQNGRLNLDVTWHRRTYVRTYLYTRRTAYPTTATAGAARAAVASNNSRVKYATTVIVPGLVPETWWRTAPPPLLSPPFLSSNRVVHAFLSRSMARTKEHGVARKKSSANSERNRFFPATELEEAVHAFPLG